MAYHRELGIVAAGNTGLYARLSPLQHLEFSARLQLVPPAQRATAIADALRAFGLSGLARARVDRLSMGQRQRVRLALAFLHQPALVLLDEPTTSLDAEGRAMLTAMVTAHLADGRAALWCLPTAEPAPVVATLRLRLARGRLAPA